MSYTVAQVLTMAQQFMVDTADNAYRDDSNEPMITYFNAGCRRFASETHCLQGNATFQASGNTISFSDIASDIGSTVDEVLQIFRVTLLDGESPGPIPKMDLNSHRARLPSSTTTPTCYRLFADTVYFDLHPDASFNGNISFLVSYTPAVRAIGDNCLIQDRWVQAIVKYIQYCCHIADRDGNLATAAYAEWEAIKLTAAEIYKALLKENG